MKTFTRAVLTALALGIVASIGHRLWLQYRPLPVTACVRRPMAQAEWAKWKPRFGTNTLMPSNIFMIDESPYPAPGHPAPISPKDICKIRALASWATWLPFRTVRIQVWSPTNVSMTAFERHTSKLEFNKDASGWHMASVEGQIDWISEDAKPILSSH